MAKLYLRRCGLERTFGQLPEAGDSLAHGTPQAIMDQLRQIEAKMATDNVEDRLSTLEKDVAQLKQQTQRVQPNWLQRIVGSMDDDPDFDHVVQLGKQIRDQDRPSDA